MCLEQQAFPSCTMILKAVTPETLPLIPNDRNLDISRSTIWWQAVRGALGVASSGAF